MTGEDRNRRISRRIGYLMLGIACAVAIYMLWQQAERTSNLVDENRHRGEVSCATARLVAYVPALQFEGEPLENFLGWLEARRDMLDIVRERDTCSRETTDLLAARVRLDRQALRELRRQRP